MSPSEIAAYIGAAAWLPQILGWIYKAIIKPQVGLVPGPTPEVGYTSLGPIFNLSCAISASRRDAIIQNITIVMRHEKGQSTVLTWQTLNETFSQIRSATGETAEVSKKQPAIALKVSTLVLAEKLIGFQDPDFQERNRALANSLIELYNHLKKTNPDYQEQTIKSKQFADLIDFYKKNVFWQEGRYMAEVRIHLVGSKRPTIQYLEFSLSRNDVDRLNQNVSEIERYSNELIKPPPKEQQVPYFWNWINPNLRTPKMPSKT